MKNILLSSVLFASILGASEFGIELGAQKNNLSADFAYGDAATRTTVNENDLGLKDSETTIKPRLYYKTGNHTFDFDFERLDLSGSNVLTKTIVFDNKTYTASTSVQSTFEMDWYRLGYRYDILSNEATNLKLGVDLHILDTDIGLVATGLDSSYSEVLPLPTLVLEADYAFNDTFGVEAKVSGITAGSKATYTEFYVGLTANCILIENGQWNLGYQSKEFDIDIDDFDGELSFKGAYLGYEYKF